MVALYRLGFLVFLIAVWSIAARGAGPAIVPDPLATLAAARAMIASGELTGALGDTLGVYLGGYGVAVAVSLPLGVLMGAFIPLGRTLEPYVYALAATPRVAFIPLVIVVLGLGHEAKIFIVFLGALMPIVVNTYAGMTQADAELVEMARATGAGRARILARIVVPGAVPFIVTGLRLGATIALINTIVAELYMAVTGLGGLLALYGNSFRMAEYFVVVIVLALVGVLVTEGLRVVESRLGRWRAPLAMRS